MEEWSASRPEKSYLEIQDIILNTGSKNGNYYFDEITISSTEVEIERKSPALPNDNVMVREVEVQQVVNETSFDIEINPWTCNTEEDDFEDRAIWTSEDDIPSLDIWYLQFHLTSSLASSSYRGMVCIIEYYMIYAK